MFKLLYSGVVVDEKVVNIVDTPTSVGANLLNGTDFRDEPDSGTTFATNKELVDNAVDGQRALLCKGAFDQQNSINFFGQIIHSNEATRVMAAQWYTLSFWAKAVPYLEETLDTTSNRYGFGDKTFYGVENTEYRLDVRGYISSAALRAGKS